MKKTNVLRNLGLTALLLTVVGCGGSALSFAGLGSLFAGTAGSGSGLLASLTGGGAAGAALLSSGGADSIATIHNPEPATLILLGSGMAAASFFKKDKCKA